MSLEEQIRELSPLVESALQKAGLTNDSDIKDLSREDLNELLPGLEQFLLRKKISTIINRYKQEQTKSIDSILNELNGFIPEDVMNSALGPGGVLHGYLPILQKMKEDLSIALCFFEAHIKLLQSYNQGNPTQDGARGVSRSDHSTTEESQTNRKDGKTQTKKEEEGKKYAIWSLLGFGNETKKEKTDDKTQAKKEEEGNKNTPRSSFESGNETKKEKTDDKTQAKKEEEGNKNAPRSSFESGNETKKEKTVKVHSVVCGETLSSHNALMKQVELKGGFGLEETIAEDCQVMMVFCPITSRQGTDIEAAMKRTSGHKDVILVLMHHTFDCDLVTSLKSASHYTNIVVEVNVLFHDTMGLLYCKRNKEAVSVIHAALQKCKLHSTGAQSS